MFKKILIPLDGSKTAEQVLPYARTLAHALKSRVELLAVVDIGDLATSISSDKTLYLNNLILSGEGQSEAYLKLMAKSFGDDIRVKCTVEKGRPEEVILEKTASDGVLTAMATHGRSGINRWLLGSVAEKVVRGAENPVLLVRAAENAPSAGEAHFKSVIVPLDGSTLAETILPSVIEWAKLLKLKVVLVRAYHIPVLAYAASDDYYTIDYEEIREDLKGEALGYLEKKAAELKRNGITEVASIAREGFGSEEILKLGRETADNLVAMCTHGRSGVKRWVLGSVTENVVRHSGNPMFVVHARSGAENSRTGPQEQG